MREFIQAIAVVSDAASVADKAALAFVLCDKGCRGGVSAEDLKSVCEEAKKLGVTQAAVAVDEAKFST